MRLEILSAGLALIVAASGVSAQTAPPSAREACRSSAISLCGTEIASQDRAAVRACLIKNFAKASPECQTAMKAMASADKGDNPPVTPPKPH